MIHSVETSTSQEKLIAAARELFHRRGYFQTSMADVLRTAGVSSSSMYHFFPSKEDLLLAVIDSYEGLLDSQIMLPAQQLATSPDRCILAVLDVYRDFMQQTEFELGCPIGSLANEVVATVPATRNRIGAIFSKWKNRVSEWVAEAFPRASQDTCQYVASVTLTLVQGTIIQSRVEKSTRPFEVARLHLADLLDRISVEMEPKGDIP